MIDFSLLTDDDIEDMADQFIAAIKEMEERYKRIQEKAEAMTNQELLTHIRTIIEESNGVFYEYQDDYDLEQTIEWKLHHLLVEAMSEEEELMIEHFTDYDLLTEEQEKSFMFARSDLYPFTLDDCYYVAYVAYGQGESFYCIDLVNKEEARYIKQYVDLNFIKE